MTDKKVTLEVSEAAIVKLALGINGCEFSFDHYESGQGAGDSAFPVIVRVMRSREGLRFAARQYGTAFEREVELTFQEIFNTIPRITKLLEKMEGGAA